MRTEHNPFTPEHDPVTTERYPRYPGRTTPVTPERYPGARPRYPEHNPVTPSTTKKLSLSGICFSFFITCSLF
ncbi:hypothetical protein FKM82_031279 [Ascaphus truei]